MDMSTIFLILGIAALFSGMRTIITKLIYDEDYEKEIYGSKAIFIGSSLVIFGIGLICSGLGFIPSFN